MFTLHCTAKLLKTLHFTPGAPPQSTTRLGNWYASFVDGPRGPIICVSERTFFPVVVPGSARDALPRALADELAKLLASLEVPAHLVEQERFAMTQSTWAKTASRSLLGVLNEHAGLASLLLRDGLESLPALNRRLAQNIVKRQFPIDLTLEAFGITPPRTARKPAVPASPPPPQNGSDKDLVLQFATAARPPVDGFVLGIPVQVKEVLREGTEQRGIAAVCQRDGGEFRISLADVVFEAGSPAAMLSGDYRRTLGLQPHESRTPDRRHKAGVLDLREPLDLVVLAAKSTALRCRVLGTQRELTLRTPVRDEVPGEIVTVQATKQWNHAGHPYLAGKVAKSRLDIAALRLPALALRPRGDWDPAEAYWGEESDPLPAWVKELVKRGPRPAFEMEQVIPGVDPDDWDSDPIIESNDLKASGQHRAAMEVLNGLLAQELRCLDAHAHLGNAEFDHDPAQALRHYRVGVAIGDQALGPDFGGVLAWGHLDNRPWLRCLHGVGICLWRLGQTKEAAAVFSRMLWLNPTDNQGARFNLEHVERGLQWEPEDE